MEQQIKRQTCCIFGHRSIKATKELHDRIYQTAKELVENKNVTTFLFGSKSKFDELCHKVITKLKQEYPHIRRIYVRAEFPEIDNNYLNYLLELYEDTYFPQHALGAGRAVYVQRNYEMINNSNFCIVYFNEHDKPTSRKSGTAVAYEYALSKGKYIFNMGQQQSPCT